MTCLDDTRLHAAEPMTKGTADENPWSDQV